MKILVSGAGGYVGNILCRKLLAKGYQVIGMDNFFKGNVDGLLSLVGNPLFTFKKGDITNREDCKIIKDVDCCISLAALVGSPICKENPILSEAVNVDGVKNLLWFKPAGTRFVHCSTECVFGPQDKEYIELQDVRPQSLYASQKRRSEQLLEDSDNTIAFRFAAGMGVSPSYRLNLLVNNLVYNAIHDKYLVVYQRNAVRNFINVEDMADCLIFGMENVQLKHKIYNAGAVSVTKGQLVELIQKKTNCHLFYGDVDKDMDSRDATLNTDRLTKAGFQPKISLETTIDNLILSSHLIKINHGYN